MRKTGTDPIISQSGKIGSVPEELIIGLVSVSDRASAGVYKDEGIPSLKEWLTSVIASPSWRDEKRLIADDQPVIEKTLKELADDKHCDLILTTGGTGPA